MRRGHALPSQERPCPHGVVVDPEAKLEEELIIRPTSETIIWNTYRGWMKSYRDLPLLINQWANVVRWEMRTRLFLRTAEFLWQEGHTAHATKAEAVEETERMLDVYATFAEEWHGHAGDQGCEDRKRALRWCGGDLLHRSHDAGWKSLAGRHLALPRPEFRQGLRRVFTNKENKQEHVWATSWGVSTRLVGALIMTHSDDNGLVLPPKLAPVQVAMVPIAKNAEQMDGHQGLCHPCHGCACAPRASP
jgi:prolyl-tRNA synthetase